MLSRPGGVGRQRQRVASRGATFAMTQLPAANRTYQRSTLTGGGQNKGQGTIPVAITVSQAGTIYARCRSATDGTTILQAPWLATADAATGTLNVSGVDARLGRFYLDLSGDGVTWQNGTTAVAMGGLTAVSGQSLAVRMFGRMDSQTATNASLGVTLPASSAVYATYTDGQRTVSTPAWASPADASNYDSTFAAEYLRRMEAAAGVSWGLIGHARGAQSITAFIPSGSESDELRAILTAAGGFEVAVWFQGHSDAAAGMSSATYQSHLTTLFADLTAYNGVRGADYKRYVGTVPNIVSTSWGTSAQINTIRSAAAAWCAANDATYVQPLDLDLIDGVHQSQQGSIALARHFYRAARPNLGLSNGDAGPVITDASRTGVDITLTTNAASLSSVGSPATRFKVFAAGSMSSALAFDATTPFAISGSNITLKLAADPGTGALDVWFGLPSDPANNGAASMVYDNITDSDGITTGRHLSANLTAAAIAGTSTGSGTLGPNLTMTSAAYTDASDDMGQHLSGGYGLTASANDNIPSEQVWTIECRFKISSAPASLRVMMGQSAKAWLGVAPDGRLIANYASSGGADNYINNTTNSGGGTNPVVTDGTWHHVALVASGSGVSLYLDGALIGTKATAPKAGVGSTAFGVRTFGFSPATYVFSGLVDEVAIWSTTRYAAPFTPPAAPYAGNETGLVCLWHLDGNGNAATA